MFLLVFLFKFSIDSQKKKVETAGFPLKPNPANRPFVNVGESEFSVKGSFKFPKNIETLRLIFVNQAFKFTDSRLLL